MLWHNQKQGVYYELTTQRMNIWTAKTRTTNRRYHRNSAEAMKVVCKSFAIRYENVNRQNSLEF